MLRYWRYIIATVFSFCFFPDYAQNKTEICFRENKGQVCDQDYKPRNDIKFYGNAGDLAFFLKQNGFSYQWKKVDSWKTLKYSGLMGQKREQQTVPEKVSIQRIDFTWLNANEGANFEKSAALPGFENYYLESCPNGALNVYSYPELFLKKIYPGIDLRWYSDRSKLKYDYLVLRGADYRKIQLQINGADKIAVSGSGELIITTSMGEITEAKPLARQQGKSLECSWVVEGNVVGFEIKNLDPNLPLVIDPLIRLWGTYYGGSDADEIWYHTLDQSGNSFICGITKSAGNIATTGAFQQLYAGCVTYYGDAFIAKFNSSGVRQWATYYGGAEDDFGSMCATDNLGNVYMSGGTSTTNTAIISTPGAISNSCTGIPLSGFTADAYLVKFNSAGNRIWGTYFGGNSCDHGWGCTVDNVGNVFITGETSSSVGIATPGAHQTTYLGQIDGFISKISSGGTLIWSTYYGGNGYYEGCGDCKTDAVGNLYVYGITESFNNIATPGSHQSTFSGSGDDNFLVKFDPAGVRQWGTYYGGQGNEYLGYLTVSGGSVCISGSSSCTLTNVISSINGYQPNYGGGAKDAFIAIFDVNGTRQWATYYGGNGSDDGDQIAVDNFGNIYLAGGTSTSGGTTIATPCTYQDVFGGGSSDAFLVKFSSSGARMWGTYYGAQFSEKGYGCNVDASNNVYLYGVVPANCGTVIASANGHQPNFGGGLWDGFLAKFNGCQPPANLSVAQEVCAGETLTLSTNPGCGILWYNAPGGAIVGTGSAIAISPVVTSTYYISDLGCGPSTLTPVPVTVDPLPVVNINASSTLICAGSSVSLAGSGANSLTWTPSGANSATLNVNPPSSINYTLTASDGKCTNKAQINIVVVPLPSLSLNYNQQPLCYASTLNIQYGGAQSYTWLPQTLIGSDNGSTIVTSTLATSSGFTVLASNSAGTLSCNDSRTFSVAVISPVNPQTSASITLCRGEKGNLSVTGGNSWQWSPIELIDNAGAQNIVVAPESSTIFSVNASVNGICPETATVWVEVIPTPTVFAGNDTIVNIGDPVELQAQGSGLFSWIGSENMSCSSCKINTVLPLTSTCYTLVLTDQFNCKAQDVVCIEITNDFGIYLPNSFTPNGDGLNEIYKPSVYGIEEIRFEIFDRWGERIFLSAELDSGWNGLYNGKTCEEGVYVYQLYYRPYKGKSGRKTGTVSLIR